MSDKVQSRRDLLVGARRLALGGAIAPILSSGISGTAEADAQSNDGVSAEQRTEATAEKVINALEGAYGRHPGQRRNHTKGVGALGSFVGNREAAVYSRSELFSGTRLEVVARFSLAGGDPESSDAEKSPRGMALEFRMSNGGLHHMTMIHTPMFFAAVPQTFLDKFIALTVDAATGKPDPAKFKAFVASHRDNDGQAKFLSENNPPPSYANCAYYGIHTFKFINQSHVTTLVKFRFVPRDGEKQLSDAELRSAPRDFLEKALIERTHKGPIHWDMILTIGEPGDPETNPTILWPKTRKEINAGTLTITSGTPSSEAGSYRINYDPLVIADGIAATDDPVLLFRSPSYATSYTRRLQEMVVRRQ